MTDQRSTRRFIEPAQQPSGPSADQGDDMDVASIITEIEQVVTTDEGQRELDEPSGNIANRKQASAPPRPSETANPQSPDGFHVTDPSESAAFDIEQLEQELDVAIDAELRNEKAPTPKATATPQATAKPTPDTTARPTRTSRTAKTQVVESHTEFDGQDDAEAVLEEATSSRTRYTIVARILRPCTAPVEKLSPNARTVLNTLAISTALWVPLLWLLVMTSGFGGLNTAGASEAPLPSTGGIETTPTD